MWCFRNPLVSYIIAMDHWLNANYLRKPVGYLNFRRLKSFPVNCSTINDSSGIPFGEHYFWKKFVRTFASRCDGFHLKLQLHHLWFAGNWQMDQEQEQQHPHSHAHHPLAQSFGALQEVRCVRPGVYRTYCFCKFNEVKIYYLLIDLCNCTTAAPSAAAGTATRSWTLYAANLATFMLQPNSVAKLVILEAVNHLLLAQHFNIFKK